MVTPAFLAAASDEVMKIYADLEDAIKTDMCRRLAKLGRISTSTDWQAKILRETGSLGGDIDKYLRSYDKKTQKTVKQLFQQLTTRATSGELAPNQAQMIAATQGYTGLLTDLHNLTRTSTATTEFVIAANNLYMQVASGAFSYTEALKSTVDALASKGLHTISYGERSYNIESMARTCVQTALGQTAGRQSMAEAEATGTDLVLVTAHEGARHTDKPANPWSNHDEWQGKVYCTAGTREYRDEEGNVHTAPDFYAATGYGEVDGLCGINCRHTFYPYYEGEAERYDNKELEEYRKADLTLDGRKVTRYEAEQELRSAERMIRGWKRKAQCQQEAGLDDTAARVKLGTWQERRASICKQTGLRPDWTREYIGTPDGKQPRGLQPPQATPATIPAPPAAPTAAKELPEFTSTLTETDRETFSNDYGKVSTGARDVIARYGDAKVDFYTTGNGYYSPGENMAHVNIAKPKSTSTEAGFKSNMVTFLHEFGHWLDYNMKGNGINVTQTWPGFKDLIKKDALDFTNKVLAPDGVQIKTFARNSAAEKALFSKVSQDLYKDNLLKDSISDIFEGATGGKITDGWGHGKSYWSRPMALEKEAFAEMFEAMATGGQRAEMMKKYLPGSFGYFQKEFDKIAKP